MKPKVLFAIFCASLVAIFSIGSVAAGFTRDPIAVSLYVPSPTLLWQATYQNTGSWYEDLLPVDVKARGSNTYVLSLLGGITSQTNILLIKYASSGSFLWEREYDGGYAGQGVTSLDVPHALAFDSLGNVYVAGTSRGFNSQTQSSTYDDFVLIKYTDEGDELWVKRYNGSGNASDKLMGMAVDVADNVYVAGLSGNSLGNPDYVILKYNSDGQLLWSKRIDNGEWDVPSAIAVDGSGVYVTGYAGFLVYPFQNVWNKDYYTVKLDPMTGSVIWSERYDQGSGLPDYATELVLDHMGNVVISGNSPGVGLDYVTIKYDALGNQMWLARYSEPSTGSVRDDIPFAITVDSDNDIVVTGSSWNTNFPEIATIQYGGQSGNVKWLRRTKGAASNYYANIRDVLVVGPDDSVYVGGYARNSLDDNDFLIEKYSRTGVTLWSFSYDGLGRDDDEVGSIGLDGQGRLIVAGQSFLNPPPGYKAFLIQKYTQ